MFHFSPNKVEIAKKHSFIPEKSWRSRDSSCLLDLLMSRWFCSQTNIPVFFCEYILLAMLTEPTRGFLYTHSNTHKMDIDSVWRSKNKIVEKWTIFQMTNRPKVTFPQWSDSSFRVKRLRQRLCGCLGDRVEFKFMETRGVSSKCFIHTHTHTRT